MTWCFRTSIEASTRPGVAEWTCICPNALASWPALERKAAQTFLVKAVQADMVGCAVRGEGMGWAEGERRVVDRSEMSAG